MKTQVVEHSGCEHYAHPLMLLLIYFESKLYKYFILRGSLTDGHLEISEQQGEEAKTYINNLKQSFKEKWVIRFGGRLRSKKTKNKNKLPLNIEN